ncbi:phage tail protein [Dactylosporangium vinaceum]|uniref:Phage tail protein n=1 Tax=Dactylosporangium vinaceum TaxID=53362 RepID=A0ABV5MLA2_9ACTN|nr:tail fiber protein [Dactylosporangium vinaceum]UAB94082.1 phage tail protein [Dactylosporangium vinaceum]
MSDQFLGEIRMFAGTFAPTGWALCNGQLLPIPQNTALFSLLGTVYGGNGTTTFALPDLQGAAPLGTGQAPGLSQYVQGETGGAETVTLLATEMPQHTHIAQAAPVRGDRNSPAAATWAEAALGRVRDRHYATAPDSTAMAANALTVTGASQPHDNLAPYLTLTFIIALTGVFPTRP